MSEIGGSPVAAGRGSQRLIGALNAMQSMTVKDWIKVVAWFVGIVFVAGQAYAQFLAIPQQLESIAKRQDSQEVVTKGLIEAVQQSTAALQILNREMSLRVESAAKEHERFDNEITRLRDRLDLQSGRWRKPGGD